RRIAWRHMSPHVWRYELTPTADGGTTVTETWDLSKCNPVLRGVLSSTFGSKTQQGIEDTLVKLKSAAETDTTVA
ncbi:MAG: hypothetical protein WB471_06420, partial [Nocardioides sp.]